MSFFLSYFVPLLLAGGVSALLTVVVKNFAHKKGWVAAPRPRDIHQKPVPRLGGVAIFLSFLLIVILYNIISPGRFDFFGFPYAFLGWHIDKRLFGILVAGLFLVATMVWDDIRGLRPWQKLLAQIITALIVIFFGIGINYLNNPFGLTIYLDQIKIPLTIAGVTYHFVLWADLLLIFWLVLMMNAVNFIDGIDGLASGVGGLAALVILILSLAPLVNQPATALVAAIVLGAILGFLPFNFYPAKIFLGDSGAMFLGFILAVLSFIGGGKLATVFLVAGIAIVDGILVVLGRIFARRSPILADKSHIHHRFLKAGFSPRQTVIILWFISLLFGIIALEAGPKFKVLAAGGLGALVVILAIGLTLKAKNG